jgi:hypothetical protein
MSQGVTALLVEVTEDCSFAQTSETAFAGHEVFSDGGDLIVTLSHDGCSKEILDANPDLDIPTKCESGVIYDWAKNEKVGEIMFGLIYNMHDDWGALSVYPEEWLHVNSAGIGCANNVIFGIRHLSAVVSFDLDTLERQWTVSSEIESDFTFENEDDKFYDQHAAHQVASCNLVMYDNGNARFEGYARSETWSRGMEYALDFDTMTVKVVFAFPTDPSSSMGSVFRTQDKTNYIVTCPDCSGTYDDELYYGKIYEVAPDSTVVSEMWIRRTNDKMYRGMTVPTYPGA